MHAQKDIFIIYLLERTVASQHMQLNISYMAIRSYIFNQGKSLTIPQLQFIIIYLILVTFRFFVQATRISIFGHPSCQNTFCNYLLIFEHKIVVNMTMTFHSLTLYIASCFSYKPLYYKAGHQSKLTTIMIKQEHITTVNTITILLNVIKSSVGRSATAVYVKLCNKFTSVHQK